MKRIFVPSESGRDWQKLLAEPGLHWKPGRSAMSTAACWETANDKLPREISTALEAADEPDLANLQLVLAVPEWEVVLPGGSTSSHTDVLALARNDRGLVAIAVEAKVDEEFGPTLGKKRASPSKGLSERLAYLHDVLRLSNPLPDAVYYQLLHRTASAVLIARLFHANAAVMVVQSFSPSDRWRNEFEEFGRILGVHARNDGVAGVPSHVLPRLFMGWCSGEQAFRDVDLRTAD